LECEFEKKNLGFKLSVAKMHVHFIGIGGIGTSALAQYYLAKGHKVSGSDLVSSEITSFLKKGGAKISIGKHKRSNVLSSVNMVIYSPAVPKNNPELKKAYLLAAHYPLKIVSYPEALGELTKQYFTIAVSGTHGKSTTTAMIALILRKAGLDPTVIVGTKLSEFGTSNFRMGKSNYLVIEADEHFASFLHYWPKMIVVTNIERDHLDYYKDLRNVTKAFYQFIRHLPPDGALVINADDKNSKLKILNPKRVHGLPCKIQRYSLRQKEANRMRKILKIPGEHNVSNALAALSTARILGIPDRISIKALSEYRGSWRRFEELKIGNRNLKIISDYAHHPTEIKATLQAARQKFPNKRIWAVFQPHQYQRTYYLFDEFVKSFDLADKIVLTDIYGVAGREIARKTKKVSGQKLAAEIKKRKKNTYFVKKFQEIPKFLKNKVGREDVVILMGAGDIYRIGSPKYWKEHDFEKRSSNRKNIKSL
jgi:UDP-N-acetylmuramate--alanine ligase